MKGLSLFSFIITIIAFVALVAIFAFVICYVMNLMLKLIKAGAEDEKIIIENEKNLKKKKKYFNIGNFLFYSLLIAVVGFSVYINLSLGKKDLKIPTPRVVVSGSMSEKNEKNKYLFENNLNDQFGVFDIIVVHNMPNEEDIKLYDVIVYKINNEYVVHRVIKIEEPNSDHPNNRLFYFQGDAIESRDKLPVKYDQMYGIYKGQKLPKIGSFVIFLQSPMGIIVIIFSIFSLIIVPILEKKLDKAYAARLAIITSTAQSTDVIQPIQTEKTEKTKLSAEQQPKPPTQKQEPLPLQRYKKPKAQEDINTADIQDKSIQNKNLIKLLTKDKQSNKK